MSENYKGRNCLWLQTSQQTLTQKERTNAPTTMKQQQQNTYKQRACKEWKKRSEKSTTTHSTDVKRV